MELFFVLIPITIVLVGLSIWAFLWSARNDQFEDLDKQAYSILFDDDEQLAQKDPLSTPDKEDAAR
jgi:cbb3-type cytochrome oxidase maturation protein